MLRPLMTRPAKFLAALLFVTGAAQAQLTIEIIGSGAIQIPIAVLPFAGESVLPQSITEIIEQDLSRSGRFRAIFVGGVNPLPTEIAQVNFPEWKSRLADAVVIGQAQRLPDGKLEVRFRLLDALKQSQIGGIAFTYTAAPAWAPDGKQLAAVLTKDGTSQIYLMSPDGTNLRRLTSSQAIDTEPFFTPDGQSIYFTSDRGGSPQIYRMPASGGEPVRMTFEGDYNVSPRVSPDGKILAYISRVSGRFQLMVMDLESKQVQALTDGQRDESPSFAPNGRIILYASDVDNRGVLAAVSSDGRFRQRLGIQAADVREPSWGPSLGN